MSLPALPENEIQLVAVDLDGTLLSDDKQLSKQSTRAIRRVIDQGVKFIIASARPPRSVREFYQALQLDTLQINYNGSLIYDEINRRNLFHQPMPGHLCQQIFLAARNLDPHIACSLEILDKWYTDFVDYDLGTETARHFQPDHLGPLDLCWQMDITKMMLLAPPDRLTPVHDKIAEIFDGQVEITVSDEHLIQIMHPSVNKATALQFVADYYNIDRQNTLAIGDAPNDAPMLQWAAVGVAVDNAWPQAKDAADVIAPNNEEHGVAWALDQFIP